MNYSMYRYFKGEKENPFDPEKENTANQFWQYEAKFEHEYSGSKENKAGTLKIWLKDLFTHLSDRYDSFDDGESFRIKYEIG